MDDPSRQYAVVQADLPAANGIIHIIDQPILRTPSDRPPRDEQVRPERMDSLGCDSKDQARDSLSFSVQFADKTVGEILTKDEKFNRFLSLVDVSISS